MKAFVLAAVLRVESGRVKPMYKLWCTYVVPLLPIFALIAVAVWAK
jgi:hypothetical protein